MNVTTDNPIYAIAKFTNDLQQTITELKTRQEQLVEREPEWLQQANKMITAGLYAAHLGIPYTFGGTYEKSKSFDCSAFVQSLYAFIGITIPRVSKNQAVYGEEVAYDNLRRGDLVFFDTNHDGIVNHVGMFVGEGKMIHTNSPSKPLRVQEIAEYGLHFYVTARRVL